MTREHRRFDRQLDKMGRSLPGLDGPLRGLTAPGRMWLRWPVAILLMAGGLVGFLPVVGFWMFPLGVVLIAIDIPGIRPFVARNLLRGQVIWRQTRARLRARFGR